MSVSVVIATAGDPARKARQLMVINALVEQSMPPKEIVLVWQGAPDHAFFSQLPAEAIVIVEEVAGVARARNIGAKASTGEFVLMLDDDTIPVGRDWLERAYAKLQAREVHFITSNIKFEGGGGTGTNADVVLSRSTARGNCSEPGWMMARDLFLRYPFDETLGVGCIHGASEGLDLGTRLIEAGLKGERVSSLMLSHPRLDPDVVGCPVRLLLYTMGNASCLVAHRYRPLYLFEFGRAGFWLLRGLARLRMGEVRAGLIRALGLAIGPLLPRRGPMIRPR